MPIYAYQCTCGQEINAVSTYATRSATVACPCGGKAQYRISAPVVQTLATHMIGADAGTQVAGDGGYLDYGIFDPKTKGPTYITSLSQKRALMKERGLRQLEPSESPDRVRELDRTKRTKAIWFS